MFSGGEREFGSNMGVLDLTTISNGHWDGWVEAWGNLTEGQRYPAAEPWLRYNPQFAAYHLGSSLKRVAGNTCVFSFPLSLVLSLTVAEQRSMETSHQPIFSVHLPDGVIPS